MIEPPSGFTYRAFISYSHRDKAWADWLHKALETYRVPSRLVGTKTAHGTIPQRLNPIFRDRDELASASELGRKVNEALGQSENQIVICSPASATSRWVNEEVLAYKRMGRGERIFCLIVDGEPNATDLPGRETEECFCPALRFQLDANGQRANERTEPIAADARPGKDGKPNAKLKLIAGMLDVGFDALKQRELQRRTRRMTAIAALALIVMAVTSVLAVYAFISRHEAVVAQQAAQRRQKQAEGLVDFMLGDLTTKLRAESRLDILQSVDDKAMAYFQSLPLTDVTDQALEQRAKALYQISSVRYESGHLPAAVEADRAALKIASKLGSEAPADIARQYEWAKILDSLSDELSYQSDNLSGEVRTEELAHQVLQRALMRSPDNLELQGEMGEVDDSLGLVLEQSGHMDAAAVAFQEQLTLERKLVAARPTDIQYEKQLGFAHQDLGKLALLDGDLATALTEMRAYDAIETRLSQANPKNNRARYRMMLARGDHAIALKMAGESAAAIRRMQQTVELTKRLAAGDPQNSRYEQLGASYLIVLAGLQRATGDLSAAEKTIGNAVTTLGGQIRKNPTDTQLQLYYAMTRAEQAAQARAAGRTKAARSDAQTALHILAPMLAKNPNESDTLLATTRAKLLLASVTVDPHTAQVLRAQALATIRAVKADGSDPRLLALQVEALLALGRKTDAQPLIKQLWHGGYRDPALVDVLKREHIDYPPNPAFEAKLLAATKRAVGNDAAAHATPVK